jgi:hypothetical protein
MNAAESTIRAKNPPYSLDGAMAVISHAEARGVVQALRQWIMKLSLDQRTRYLSGARDHADLEKRMRDWDERRNHSFPYLP